MHILLCSDTAYFQHLLVTLCSIINSNENNEICFHIFGNGLEKRCKNIVVDILKKYPQKQCVFYDIENIEEKLGRKVNVELSINVYMRLFVTAYIPTSVQKILYLDSDVIVREDLSPLFDIEMSSYDIAAVKGTMDNKNGDLPHINSGVILFNLARCRKNNALPTYISIIEKNEGYLQFHDQTVLFEAHKGAIYYLDLKYNVTTPINYLSYKRMCMFYSLSEYYNEDMYNNARKHPVITHMTSWVFGRPWAKKSCHPNHKEYVDILLGIKYDYQLVGSRKKNYLFYLFLYRFCPIWILRTKSYIVRFIKNLKNQISATNR